MNSAFAEKLSRVDNSPGVYLMQDADGSVIYVGKAKELKKRLSAYGRPKGQLDIKTGVLMRHVADFQIILTASEKEALILEQTLIKRHKPRYNVILKDDKRYPSLRLDLKHPYPNLSIVRKLKKDGAAYFGPYASALAVRRTMRFINKHFMLRKCKNHEFKTRTRPCLHYQMHACLAPCCLPVAAKDYGRLVKQVTLFLNGRTPQLIREVKREMSDAAGREAYEKAARYRDLMFSLEKTLEKQLAVTTDFKNRDVLGVAATDQATVITLMTIRGGHLQGSRHFPLDATLATDAELIETFIRQYYRTSRGVPGEILVPALPDVTDLLEQQLGETAGHRVRIIHPRRGGKVRLINMAEENAASALKDLMAGKKADTDLLAKAQKRLKLNLLPERIECFDNSNIQGASPVAAMVVYEQARPNPSSYRRYRIRDVAGPDDYATMAEVLSRRYSGADADMPYPDLLLVDGGKGQLNIACRVLKQLGLAGAFDVAAIAKENPDRGDLQDKIYKPGRKNPLHLSPADDVLRFVQRIRDAAHRFAIGYHRQHRGRRALTSTLDDIPGIGPRRKAALLAHFKTIDGIRNASTLELQRVPGMTRRSAESVRRAMTSDPVKKEKTG